MKKVLNLLCLLFLLSSTLGCESFLSSDKSDRLSKKNRITINIGVIGPMSGEDSHWGKSGLQGIKAAIELANQNSSNYFYKIIVKDDRNRPKLAQNLFKDIVEIDNVSAVLLLSKSEVALSLSKTIDSYEIPVFALMSTHSELTGNSVYLSQLLIDNSDQAIVAAMYIRDELIVDKVGVVNDATSEYTSYLADKFIETFESVGGKVIEIEYSLNEDFLTSDIEKLKSNNLRYIYIPLGVDHFITFTKKLLLIKYSPQLISSDGLTANLLLKYPEELSLADGMIVTESYSSDEDLTVFGKAINKIMIKKTGAEITTLAAQGAEGASIIVSAINNCHPEHISSCINNSLRSTEDFVGYLDKISIRRDGQSERPVYINQLNKNKQNSLVKVY